MAKKKKTTEVPTECTAADYINQVYMSMPKEDQEAFDEKVNTLLNDSKTKLKDELYHMATGAPKMEEPVEEKPKRRRKKSSEEAPVEETAAPETDVNSDKDESK